MSKAFLCISRLMDQLLIIHGLHCLRVSLYINMLS